MVSNVEIAKILFEIADVLEVEGVDWKPVAYRRAARVIETLADGVEKIFKEKGIGGLRTISGVGEGIAGKIAEFLETGRIKEYEQLKKRSPKGLEELLHVPSIGPKKAKVLVKKLRISSIKELERACKEGRIRRLAGFGKKSEDDILRGVSLLKQGRERLLLGSILPIAEELLSYVRSHRAVNRAEIGGSIRRRKETCKDVDILVASKRAKEVMDHFVRWKGVQHVLAKGLTKSTVILKSGIQADVRVLEEKNFGAALQYFTGNKDHNVALRTIAIKKGLKLSEYGLFDGRERLVAGRTEEEVYRKLGLRYVAPELRENTGEIEAARQEKLPDLISYDSIRGDLHMHTTWSDGSASSEAMVRTAVQLGYEYVAITDHSPSERIAHGLDVKRLLAHKKEVEKLRRKYPKIEVLFGSEVSILGDGRLDYPDKVLRELDWVVASVHSRFKSPFEVMTKRICKAIENPYVNALGHPTGRIIQRREPYAVHLEKVYETAGRCGVALEINSFPSRLDLSDINIKKAKEYGVHFVISTDSHSPDHLRFMQFGVAQARRGWLEEKDVLNVLSKKAFLKAIRRRHK